MVLGELLGLVGAVVADKGKLATSLKLIQVVSLYFAIIAAIFAVILYPPDPLLRIYIAILILIAYMWLRRYICRQATEATQDRKTVFEDLIEKAIDIIAMAIKNSEDIEKVLYENINNILSNISFVAWTDSLRREFEKWVIPAIVLYWAIFGIFSLWWSEAIVYIEPNLRNAAGGFLLYTVSTATLSVLKFDIEKGVSVSRRLFGDRRYKLVGAYLGLFAVFFFAPYALLSFMLDEFSEPKWGSREALLRYKSSKGRSIPKNVESEALEVLKRLVEKYEVRSLSNPKGRITDHWDIINNIDYMFESPLPTDIAKLHNSYFIVDREKHRFSVIEITLKRVEERVTNRPSRRKATETRYRYFIHINEGYFRSSIIADVESEVLDTVVR